MAPEPQIRKLTVAQWLAVPDNPGARPRRDIAAHLHTLQEEHRDVTMATLPDGSECKVDGHKRAQIWRNKISDKVPDSVLVRVFNVESAEEACQLYNSFNSGGTI